MCIALLLLVYFSVFHLCLCTVSSDSCFLELSLSFFFFAVTGLSVGIVFSVLLFKRKYNKVKQVSFFSSFFSFSLFFLVIALFKNKQSWLFFLHQGECGLCRSGQAWGWEWDTPTASMTSGLHIWFMAAWLRWVWGVGGFFRRIFALQYVILSVFSFFRTNSGTKATSFLSVCV